jgi:hypothetical protein
LVVDRPWESHKNTSELLFRVHYRLGDHGVGSCFEIPVILWVLRRLGDGDVCAVDRPMHGRHSTLGSEVHHHLPHLVSSRPTNEIPKNVVQCSNYLAYDNAHC